MLFRKFICGLLKFFGIQTTYCCEDKSSTVPNPVPRNRDSEHCFNLLFYAPYEIVAKAFPPESVRLSVLVNEAAEVLVMKAYDHKSPPYMPELIRKLALLHSTLRGYSDSQLTALEIRHFGCQVTGGWITSRVFFWQTVREIMAHQDTLGRLMGHMFFVDGSYMELYDALVDRAAKMQEVTAMVVTEAKDRIKKGTNPDEMIYVIPVELNIGGTITRTYKPSSSFPKEFADSVPVSKDCWLPLHKAAELPT